MATGENTDRGVRRKRQWLVSVAMCACALALSVWFVFFANRPAREAGQLVISPPGRPPVTLTLWVAEPQVDLPFTTDTAWVRCGRTKWKLHDRGFGNSVGRVAVSPDLTQAAAYRWFQGHDRPAVLIDLRTGVMQPANPWADYESKGWTMHKWQWVAE